MGCSRSLALVLAEGERRQRPMWTAIPTIRTATDPKDGPGLVPDHHDQRAVKRNPVGVPGRR